MTKQKAFKESLALADKAVFAMLGTVDKKGCPNIRAVLKMENKGLKKIWFSTNTSSEKVAEIRKNSKTCVYITNLEKWSGLTLKGTARVLGDMKSRKKVWREGFEKYYPLGINDPDYSVICFTAEKAKYYHNLSKTVFNL